MACFYHQLKASTAMRNFIRVADMIRNIILRGELYCLAVHNRDDDFPAPA
jgi:hypothetical protein